MLLKFNAVQESEMVKLGTHHDGYITFLNTVVHNHPYPFGNVFSQIFLWDHSHLSRKIINSRWFGIENLLCLTRDYERLEPH